MDAEKKQGMKADKMRTKKEKMDASYNFLRNQFLSQFSAKIVVGSIFSEMIFFQWTR